ncbi:MAG: SPOR domain-containing protein [Ignavibacteriales bacterium]|nr:SPOR domain-containing protein [Ignavibacteriales bacterium]
MYKGFIIFFIAVLVYCQEVDIIPYLQQVEKGEITQVRVKIDELKRTNSTDPSVQFLDAVITSDGQSALDKYLKIVQIYPDSKYADAAVFRIYSYYYAVGSYVQAKNYFDMLKNNYPNSPYVDFTTNIPSTNETEIQPNTNIITDNKNYNYSIQAGAFLSFSNAETLRQKFVNDGYYSDITQKVVGGSTLNVVRVGRFATYQEAQKFITVLDAKYQIKGSVISY